VPEVFLTGQEKRPWAGEPAHGLPGLRRQWCPIGEPGRRNRRWGSRVDGG